jgi:hypothetical protein
MSTDHNAPAVPLSELENESRIFLTGGSGLSGGETDEAQEFWENIVDQHLVPDELLRSQMPMLGKVKHGLQQVQALTLQAGPSGSIVPLGRPFWEVMEEENERAAEAEKKRLATGKKARERQSKKKTSSGAKRGAKGRAGGGAGAAAGRERGGTSKKRKRSESGEEEEEGEEDEDEDEEEEEQDDEEEEEEDDDDDDDDEEEEEEEDDNMGGRRRSSRTPTSGGGRSSSRGGVTPGTISRRQRTLEKLRRRRAVIDEASADEQCIRFSIQARLVRCGGKGGGGGGGGGGSKKRNGTGGGSGGTVSGSGSAGADSGSTESVLLRVRREDKRKGLAMVLDLNGFEGDDSEEDSEEEEEEPEPWVAQYIFNTTAGHKLVRQKHGLLGSAGRVRRQAEADRRSGRIARSAYAEINSDDDCMSMSTPGGGLAVVSSGGESANRLELDDRQAEEDYFVENEDCPDNPMDIVAIGDGAEDEDGDGEEEAAASAVAEPSSSPEVVGSSSKGKRKGKKGATSKSASKSAATSAGKGRKAGQAGKQPRASSGGKQPRASSGGKQPRAAVVPTPSAVVPAPSAAQAKAPSASSSSIVGLRGQDWELTACAVSVKGTQISAAYEDDAIAAELWALQHAEASQARTNMDRFLGVAAKLKVTALDEVALKRGVVDRHHAALAEAAYINCFGRCHQCGQINCQHKEKLRTHEVARRVAQLAAQEVGGVGEVKDEAKVKKEAEEETKEAKVKVEVETKLKKEEETEVMTEVKKEAEEVEEAEAEEVEEAEAEEKTVALAATAAAGAAGAGKVAHLGDGLGGNVEWNPQDEPRYLWYESQDARVADENIVSTLMGQLAQARHFRTWRREASDEQQLLVLLEEQRSVNRRTIEGTMQIVRHRNAGGMGGGAFGGGTNGGSTMAQQGANGGGMNDEQRRYRQQRVQAQRQKHMLQIRRKNEKLALYKVYAVQRQLVTQPQEKRNEEAYEAANKDSLETDEVKLIIASFGRYKMGGRDDDDEHVQGPVCWCAKCQRQHVRLAVEYLVMKVQASATDALKEGARKKTDLEKKRKKLEDKKAQKAEAEQNALATKRRRAEAKAEARAASEQMKTARKAKGAVDKHVRQQQRQQALLAKQTRKEEQREERARTKLINKKAVKAGKVLQTKVWMVRTGMASFDMVDEQGGLLPASAAEGGGYAGYAGGASGGGGGGAPFGADAPAKKRQKIGRSSIPSYDDSVEYNDLGVDGFGGGDASPPEEEEFVDRLPTTMAWLDKLMLDPISELFLERVSDDIAPGYSQVVAHPICLGDIKDRLESGVYSQGGDGLLGKAMRPDFDLLYTNCKLYNEEGSPITDLAKRLRDRCKTLCKSEARHQQKFF